MRKTVTITWLRLPESHDYLAAASYLALTYKDVQVAKLIQKLKKASMTEFKAKDIFRASGLSLLGISNAHIAKDRKKIEAGRPLSSLLLIRDPQQGKVIIADGYHRLCAAYSFNEDAIISCKIAG